jgi:hypothetical protein
MVKTIANIDRARVNDRLPKSVRRVSGGACFRFYLAQGAQYEGGSAPQLPEEAIDAVANMTSPNSLG